MKRTQEWLILCVDDDADIAGQVQEFIDGEIAAVPSEIFRVVTTTQFPEALGILDERRVDAVILDLRLGDPSARTQGEEAGRTTLNAIRARRFVPIVFYTGLPQLVRDLESPVVSVVEKTEGVERLLEVLRQIFNSNLPRVNHALIRHVEEVQRKYMWDFVASHWEELGMRGDGVELAYLLARRLAASLSAAGIEDFAASLGAAPQAAVDPNQRHPVQYYIAPPVTPVPYAGEILSSTKNGMLEYQLLLTPSCDMAQCKADHVLLARSELLTTQAEYAKWAAQAEPSKTATDALTDVLKNNRKSGRERYFFLPGALNIPNMVVDFQQLKSIPCADVEQYTRHAALDSPFVESLLSQFVRYFGRLGTPDLAVQVVLEKLAATRAHLG